MRKTCLSERPAAQAAFAKEAANVKAAKATPSTLALDLIEANQALAAKPLARGEHDDRSVRAAARLPRGWVSGCSRSATCSRSPTSRFPTLWAWMRAGHVSARARGRRANPSG